jgi:hypothetical protein
LKVHGLQAALYHGLRHYLWKGNFDTTGCVLNLEGERGVIVYTLVREGLVRGWDLSWVLKGE